MKVRKKFRKISNQVEEALMPQRESHVLRNIGYATAGVSVVALGLIVGRELRERYKFNRRTPYDFYAHSGDQMQDVEFGVGI
ncbi:hypothetical protein ACFQBQ_10710 [Granulicella cerasi]|uniref:Uncharacterized protein n=1 Tax=Granulicella cerasi TaxID=741063 RepID=A0ABW1ZCX4_9BACT|nr:hypothetical protein [Granulicella cerasi]